MENNTAPHINGWTVYNVTVRVGRRRAQTYARYAPSLEAAVEGTRQVVARDAYVAVETVTARAVAA